MAKTNCVDISYCQTKVDFKKLKAAGITTVIIRAGFGRETSQKDNMFESHYKNAKAAGLNIGVYWYSYATGVADAEKEAKACLSCIKGKTLNLPVYYDMEENSIAKLGKETCTKMALKFCSVITKNGYRAGVYANSNWYNNYLNYNTIKSKYSIWLAHWNDTHTIKCDVWQHGVGKISGVNRNCDLDYIENSSIIKNKMTKKDTAQKKNTITTKKTATKTTTKTASTITEAQLRQKVANTINGWLGATEGSAGHKEILKIYNAQNPLPVGYKMKDYDAWCAATVSATWLKVGIAKYITTECSCGRFIDNAKKLGIWVENDAYKPKIGDAVIYDWDDSGIGDDTSGASHTGIVTAVNGNKFIVTEGNTGNGIVAKREMQVNGKYIRGFIAPKYGEIAKKVSGKITPDKTNSNSSTKKKDTSTTVIKPSIYTKCVSNGKWQKEIKDGADYNGIIGKALVAFATKVTSGSIKYSVHIKGGSWLGNVTGYNKNDYKNGYAGNGNPAEKGKAIDAIKIYYTTPQAVANKYGYYKVAYRVHTLGGKWLPWQYDTETTKGQDGYAGIIGKTIDAVQVKLVKA